MGTVTRVDFREEKRALTPAERLARTQRLADRIAAAWYSPAGRVVATAGVFLVLLTGLGILVAGAVMLVGRS